MKRDAIPQHEIDRIVERLRNGETLARVEIDSTTIAEAWFRANERSLLKLASTGVAPEDPTQVDAAASDAPASEPESSAATPRRRQRKATE